MHARLLEVGRLWLSRIEQVDDMNTVPIVFAFDNNLVFPACVCLSSLMMSAKETTFYDIFILYPSSDEFERKDIDKVQEFYPNCRIQYIAVDDTFAEAFEIRGITTPAYYRLLIPELIPQYDKILYSDVDVIFRSDLYDIYSSTDMQGCLLAGVNSLSHLVPAYAKYCTERLKRNPRSIVYSGNLIFNGKQMREEHTTEKLIEHRGQKYMFQDMDILNVVCEGRIKFLPPCFCLSTFIAEQAIYGREKLTEIWTDQEIATALSSGIVHYNGQKPWQGWCINFDIWWEYYRKSPFFDEKFYFDFFYNKLNEHDQLPLWKRVKILLRYFVIGRQQSR